MRRSIFSQGGNRNMVYVLSQKKKPLMPCSNVIARLLLKQDKAKVKHRTPFTIQLTYATETEYVQVLTHGVDTGSNQLGSAVVDENANVLYQAEVEIRNDITEKMTRRAKYRRNRRNRKTRYRKARFINRKNSIRKERFSSTVTSKLNSNFKEIRFVSSILPIQKNIIETGNFDMHALKNPAVLKNKWLYQKGINYGFANTKQYVLFRDGYTCQCCKGKSKEKKREVHHKMFRSQGGSDEEANLVTLCHICHKGLHNGTVVFKDTGKKKGQLKHATQMNAICVQLLKHSVAAEETFGFVTKEHRQLAGLPKTHANDAVMIACQTRTPTFKSNVVLFKKCVADGDDQRAKGVRSEQRIPVGKIQGFRKFDKVKHQDNEYFIKGRMSTGYAILMTIDGVKVNLKPIPKFETMQRIGARKTWITTQKIIQNSC